MFTSSPEEMTSKVERKRILGASYSSQSLLFNSRSLNSSLVLSHKHGLLSTNSIRATMSYLNLLDILSNNFTTLYYTRNSIYKDEQKSKHLSSPESLQNNVRSHGRRVPICSAHQTGVFIEGFAGITPTSRWSS